MGKARLEAFSDGVFAIAITLLVLTITTPDDYHHLGSELADRWPAYAAYVVSFAVIGIMWLNHHTIFGHFAHVDRNLVYLNLLLLATVVFIPYPTGIFGQALQRGEGERVAAVVYSVAMTVNALAWAALWLYGSSRRRLLDDAFPEAQRRTATVLFTIGQRDLRAHHRRRSDQRLRVPRASRRARRLLRARPALPVDLAAHRVGVVCRP